MSKVAPEAQSIDRDGGSVELPGGLDALLAKSTSLKVYRNRTKLKRAEMFVQAYKGLKFPCGLLWDKGLKEFLQDMCKPICFSFEGVFVPLLPNAIDCFVSTVCASPALIWAKYRVDFLDASGNSLGTIMATEQSSFCARGLGQEADFICQGRANFVVQVSMSAKRRALPPARSR